ncbi:MAG: hypothetical protein FJ265_21570 [Planctomycetes bacterium]|nr:hypothetical protein [Planctomycetota bacterium]
MVCELRLRPQQTKEQRRAEVDAALRRLAAALTGQTVRVVIGPNGTVTFAGWDQQENEGVSDACAFRTLSAWGSPELRFAVARAEALQGRKVDRRVAAIGGLHSHDGGTTWHPGH